MTRYKKNVYSQSRLITINIDNHIFPGTFKDAPHFFLDNKIGFSVFDLVIVVYVGEV